jgi:hypothetical protein
MIALVNRIKGHTTLHLTGGHPLHTLEARSATEPHENHFTYTVASHTITIARTMTDDEVEGFGRLTEPLCRNEEDGSYAGVRSKQERCLIIGLGHGDIRELSFLLFITLRYVFDVQPLFA